MKAIILGIIAAIALGISTVFAGISWDDHNHVNGGSSQSYDLQTSGDSVTATLEWSQPNRALSLQFGEETVSGDSPLSITLPCGAYCNIATLVSNLTEFNTVYVITWEVQP